MIDETIAELTRRRGAEEETAVREILLGLSHTLEPAYAAPNAVFIPTTTGHTEIDALFICPVGIFVFECKHMTGTVLGKPADRMWTKTGETILSFPNPLLQNKRHADAAAVWFGIPRQYCFSYTVFNDGCS
ncbi:MAG TPA: nuclease-related domain-containing protein, partial [Methanocorpusculum sp.]|nr:nuclease-related domain-containing protein [Methanocorpusculum sp.]